METVIHLPQGLKNRGIRAAIDDYRKRISDIKLTVSDRLPEKRGDGEVWVGLDREGRQVTTEALHEWLQKKSRNSSTVRFLIGGKQGLEEARLKKCDWKWSLGPLVLGQFPAALVVAEQLYRCYSLRSGHPYHEV